MKYSIIYNEDKNFFYIQTDGCFCIQKFSELANALLTHQKWTSGTDCIFDYRKTEFLNVPSEELRKASSIHQEKNEIVGSGKSAFVMKDAGNFGMGRMYQNFTENTVRTKFGVFQDLDEAQKWVTNS